MRILAIAAFGVLLGCEPDVAFRPAERATATSPSGYSAADYDIMGPYGHFADAKVWSRGAYEADMKGDEHIVIHVGFIIENSLDRPIVLDESQLVLDSVTIEGERTLDRRPDWLEGDVEIPPGSEREVHVYFVLGTDDELEPWDIDAFRARWVLRDVEGRLRYSQRTPFLPRRPDVDRATGYYYSPFYDPFYHGPHYYNRSPIVHPSSFRHHDVVR